VPLVLKQREGAVMASAALKSRVTPEQYLAIERKSEYKSEYLDGVIYAMSGASFEHNSIAMNLAAQLHSRLRDSPCRVVAADQRVCVAPTGLYTYPDIAIVCAEPQFLDGEFDTLLNPTVLIEVLSPSTEAYDRGKKFGHYRRIASLREYVLVAQDRVSVERYVRRGQDWVLTEWNSLDESLRLDSIEGDVPLREIYAKVVIPKVDDAGDRA
jgi:Uma2 family endonuclease